MRGRGIFEVVVYVDGACSGNPGLMGVGVVLIWGERRKEISLFEGEGTSNRAELLAVIRGLEALRYPERTKVVMYSDSELVVKVINKEYRARANLDLVKRIEDLMKNFKKVEIKWIRGHSGYRENERADKLARDAIRVYKKIMKEGKR